MKYAFTFFLLFIFAVQTGAQEKSLTYTVDGKPYEGYYVSPSQGAPLIILIHDWDGLTEYEITRAEMLQGMGYAVFAADLFGKGIRPKELQERQRLTGELYKNREKMRSLLNAALNEAKIKNANTDNAVMVGYCFGGTSVLEFARSGADMKGFVSFHGGLMTPEGQDYSGVRGTIIVFHGTADESVTMDHFSNLAKELEKYKIPHEMTTYGGAPHAFTVFNTERYRKDADRKSWNRFSEFLHQTLK
ncbi:MAG: dienelactone hydrolase family protein [Syntrophales bacterium]|jgi:dienelactone hydrolase|nr:dienelactone hydrolase family protein [Syntrophales bacterium]MDY0045343.1 dienelactone hydrolase family protein [Syntrophales bacterium]